MQNERENQGKRFFVLIQKLNFIFANESFNEMNTCFLMHLDSNERVSFIHITNSIFQYVSLHNISAVKIRIVLDVADVNFNSHET